MRRLAPFFLKTACAVSSLLPILYEKAIKQLLSFFGMLQQI